MDNLEGAPSLDNRTRRLYRPFGANRLNLLTSST
jgi:hypothetical protein